MLEGPQGVKDRIHSYGKNCSFNIEVHQSNIINDPLPLQALKEGIRVANLDVDLYEATFAGLFKIAPHILLGGTSMRRSWTFTQVNWSKISCLSIYPVQAGQKV